MSHVPDHCTWSGFINLMCLCIYRILMNVLDYDTYRHPGQTSHGVMLPTQRSEWNDSDWTGLTPEERKACIYARGQAIEIMTWVNHSCLFAPDDTDDALSSMSIGEYQVSMVAHYCQMIFQYKTLAVLKGYQGPPSCQRGDIHLQLMGTASGNMNSSIQAALNVPVAGQKRLGMEIPGWHLIQRPHEPFQQGEL